MIDKPYLSTPELMEFLAISRSTIHRLLDRGLPNIMIGRLHRFNREEVLSWLKEGNGQMSKPRRKKRTRIYT